MQTWLPRLVLRRTRWLLRNMTWPKVANLAAAGVSYITGRKRVYSWPLALKIDISPLCSLRCTCCIHAEPSRQDGLLARQSFDPSQRMSIEQFARIIKEIAPGSLAVSMYYLGDPYMHPDVDAMCGIANSAGLNVHLSSHFSYAFDDDRIASIARSGVTHLTVCLDGATQETYGITRVGGNLVRALDNLKRLSAYKRKHRLTCPELEVQFVKFRHNLHELHGVKRAASECRVDVFSVTPGQLHNYVDLEPGNYAVRGPNRTRLFPQCSWPYTTMVIKYNGDVIPCCWHRLGKQYTDLPDKRVLGNVFHTSVLDVWNNTDYRRIRQLVCRPGAVRKHEELHATFCDACRCLNRTDIETSVERIGPDYDYRDVLPGSVAGPGRENINQD